jgi:four helix bundle protein
MATIKNFEELEIWKLAREQAKTVYFIVNSKLFEKEFEIKNQIKKSAGSVMDNIAEGFERGGNAEFINFLGIAKGSNGETRSQLIRALDNNFIEKETFDQLYNQNIEISKKINSFIEYLKNCGQKGFKFYKP